MHDTPSKASYISGIFAFLIGRIADMFSNVNWADVASVTGIVIGVATFLVNWYYKKKDFELKEKELEQRIHQQEYTFCQIHLRQIRRCWTGDCHSWE